MPDDAHVTYVELPLPPGCSPGTFGHIANPDPPALDQATVETMIYQVTRRPAWPCSLHEQQQLYHISKTLVGYLRHTCDVR